MIAGMLPPASSPSGRVLGALALLAVIVVAFLAGVLVERLRFDARRTATLHRYDEALRQHQEHLMQSEKESVRAVAR